MIVDLKLYFIIILYELNIDKTTVTATVTHEADLLS